MSRAGPVVAYNAPRVLSAARDSIAQAENNFVYLSRTPNGVVQYVGITNNLARRSAEHLAAKGIDIRPLMKGLTRSDARAVEQTLIVMHGLNKNGGTLMNQINSIAKTNPNYATQLQRGSDLLKSVGYK
ncbi:MAG TPA: GIY-YIG nuclease family protein [Spirochaetota bacterium]|nr:GIY-YIG nuclease family protein [Spirochaetota bacterium]HNT11378.1 GIY-YIG nuclease family protein [Spirochaetota bacterium]